MATLANFRAQSIGANAKHVRHRGSMEIGTDIDSLTSGKKRNSHGGVRKYSKSAERKPECYPRARRTTAAGSGAASAGTADVQGPLPGHE